MAKGSTWFKIKRAKVKAEALNDKLGTAKRWKDPRPTSPLKSSDKVARDIAAQRQSAKQARRDSKCGLIQRHK